MGNKNIQLFQKLIDLSGKVAIITGAGQGIGETISLFLAEAKAIVVLVDKIGPNVNELQYNLKAKKLRSLSIEADVGCPEDVEEMVNRTLDAYKRIDILVNNAGIRIIKNFMKTSFEEWNETIKTNLTGTFLCTKAVIPQMISQRSGKIINISSCGGLVGIPFRSAYCASKSGIIGLTRSLAAEIGVYGICVNAIAPGVIETNLTANYFRDPKVVSSLKSVTPLRKWGQTEDIALATLYLSSDAANFVTGAVLSVDGGFAISKEF